MVEQPAGSLQSLANLRRGKAFYYLWRFFMSSKPFKTHDQHLRILRERGLDIPTGSSFSTRAKKILKREGYYNVINGYKDIFLQFPSRYGVDDIYKVGTSFDAIYSLFSFDRNMRSIFLKNILIVEGTLKSRISYYFSKEYKSDFNYLNINNYNPKRIRTTTKLIAKISSTIQNDTNSKKGQIPHYLEKHKCLPLWVLMKKLTFGIVTYFYSCITKKQRQEISQEILDDYQKEYQLEKIVFPDFEYQLEKILYFINKYRNVCAHEERLFNTEYRDIDGQIPRITHSHIRTHLDFNSKFYDLLVLLKLFLTKKEFQRLIKQVDEEWDILSENLNSNIFNSVMIRAGFPKDWEDKIS